MEKSFDFGIFEDESFFADDDDVEVGDYHSSPIMDLESIAHSSYTHPLQSSQSRVLASIVPVQSSPTKPLGVTPPPLNLSKLSPNSRDRDTKKKKVRSKQQSQSHKKGKKTKREKRHRGDPEESLRNVNNDLYDRPLPKSDHHYGGNSVDSFDLEYLSRNVHRMSAGATGRSGQRGSDYGNDIVFNGIEEKLSHDDVLYGGSPNLSSTIYKEEKESDAPTHFDLEYFTRVHDASTVSQKKKDHRGGNNGASCGVGMTSTLGADMHRSTPFSDSISPVTFVMSGKGREKGYVKREGWADALLKGSSDRSPSSSDLAGSFLRKNNAAAVRSFNFEF